MGRLQTVGLLVVHSKLKEDRITWQLSGLERPKDVFHGWSTHLENVRVQSRTEKKSEAEGERRKWADREEKQAYVHWLTSTLRRLCKKLSAVSAKVKDTGFQSSRRQILVVSCTKIIWGFSRTSFFVCSVITGHVCECEGLLYHLLNNQCAPNPSFPDYCVTQSIFC